MVILHKQKGVAIVTHSTPLIITPFPAASIAICSFVQLLIARTKHKGGGGGGGVKPTAELFGPVLE